MLTCFGILIVTRLFFLQIAEGDYYSTLAERQQISSQILAGRRGEIKIQSKDGKPASIATTRNGSLLYVNPMKLVNATSTFKTLSALLAGHGLRIDEADFFNFAQKSNDPFEILLKRLDPLVADEIIGSNLPGIGTIGQEWRFYPFGGFAAHATGFVGFDEFGEEHGRYGLESFYEKTLQGIAGFRQGPEGYGGLLLNFSRGLFTSASEGKDIVLTLDLRVQEELEARLDEVFRQWHPRHAAGLIIEPKTGRILAMASRPEFDLNDFSSVSDISYFTNPLVSSIFELGSVFKPLTMAFALDSEALTPETTYYDAGFVDIGPAHISNYDGKGRGTVNMQEVLNQSLNTGAVFAANKLGKEKFLDYIEKFGFDEKTDIDLPSESIGDISNLYTMRDVEFASASFGQGIAISPMSFVRAVSALANGGVLMRPYVVERIERDGLPDETRSPREVRRVISEKTSLEISRMLVNVVDDALLGGGLGPKNYSVAAKTGTAQIPNKDGKGYSGEFLHAFFGYAPAYDAKFLIFLMLEAPQGVEYASQSLGHSFLDLTNFLLHYYEIPPDR
mgnify:FL=1